MSSRPCAARCADSADALDPDSAYLTPELVKAVEQNASPGPADIGVELTRQYYLRVVSARDGSPGAKAGLRTGDYIRAIDGRATRDMSAYEGDASPARRCRIQGRAAGDSWQRCRSS